MGLHSNIDPRPRTTQGMDTFTPRRRMAACAAGLLAAALLLTSCADGVRSAGQEENSSPVTSAEAASSPDSPNASAFETDADMLVEAWEAASGSECAGGVPDTAIDGLEKFVLCTEVTFVASYTDPDTMPVIHELMLEGGEPMTESYVFLTGDLWGAFVDPEVATAMQSTVGGEISTIEESGLDAPELAESTQAPTQIEPIEVTGIEDLIVAWEKVTGDSCGSTESGDLFNELSVKCGDGGEVAVYEDNLQLEIQLQVLRTLLEDVDVKSYRLAGEDWTAGADLETLEKLQAVIGGEIISVSS